MSTSRVALLSWTSRRVSGQTACIAVRAPCRSRSRPGNRFDARSLLGMFNSQFLLLMFSFRSAVSALFRMEGEVVVVAPWWRLCHIWILLEIQTILNVL